MSIVHLNQALSECSPDQRAYLALELAREEQKHQQRSQFWERVEAGVTTTLVGLTLLTLLNSKLNQVTTNWYQALAGGAESEAIAIETEVETLPDESSDVLGLPKPLAHNEMVPGGKVSSLYGDRLLNGVPDFHAGLDIAAPEGTPILAPIDLCIKQAIPDGDGSGFGNYLISNPKGRDDVEMIFAHNSKNIAVSGQCYKQGEVIAEVGNTGNSFGAHLHLEITDLSGNSDPNGNGPWDVDPAPWFGVKEVEWGK